MWLVSNLEGEYSTTLFGFGIDLSFSDRFSDDKCFVTNNEHFVVHDGVTLNKIEIRGSSKQPFSDVIVSMLNESPLFFSSFVGPFTGCYYDDISQNLIAYGNQTGDAAVFYYCDNGIFAASSDFNMLVDWCRKHERHLTFNTTAANHILSLGYITEGNTVLNEIHKVKPGEYISFKNKNLQILTYHRFEFGNYSIVDMEDAILQLDRSFRKAVKRCFDKDLEYGYKEHLVDISGGLDSRMTNWVAKQMGYSNFLNICYAQSGSREQEYGELVSKILDNSFYFEAMDSAEFVFDLEKLIKMNFGQAIYLGITGGERLLSHLDFTRFGLEHTGQLGDVAVGYKGSVLSLKGKLDPDAIAYSTIVKPKLNEIDKYDNEEEFSFYYRFFNGTLSTHYIRRNYTEAVSPFIDTDFLQLCFHISPKLRRNHNLYWEWIKKCYPDAATIPSTRNRGNLRMRIYHALPQPISRRIIKICKAIGLTSMVSDRRSMNPLDLWYAENENIQTFINNYYNEHCKELQMYSNLYADLVKMFQGERVNDKLLALTVIGSYKVYVKG